MGFQSFGGSYTATALRANIWGLRERSRCMVVIVEFTGVV